MAEWLRRQTRNLVGSALVGSNPADVAILLTRSERYQPRTRILAFPSAHSLLERGAGDT